MTSNNDMSNILIIEKIDNRYANAISIFTITTTVIYTNTSKIHCLKSVRIRNYSGLHFPTFGQNTERYGVSLRIQAEYGKMRTRITSNKDTFYAVIIKVIITTTLLLTYMLLIPFPFSLPLY